MLFLLYKQLYAVVSVLLSRIVIVFSVLILSCHFVFMMVTKCVSYMHNI